MPRERALLLRNTALCGAVFLVILDRLAKAAALSLWREPIEIIPNVLNLVLSKNPGIAFSIGLRVDPLYLIIPIAAVIAILALRSFKRERFAEASAFAVIFLGAASNLYDRLVYGFVIDYFDVRFFSIFNLADVLITGGVVWLFSRQLKSRE